ncbi:hypothetical protein [Microbacterium sp. NPDC056052]|uniref:hypothetical protein n=1 Tax=Microbacterium sp. NPDC056052 TaxID=3345695 RepID=UPI0035D65803
MGMNDISHAVAGTRLRGKAQQDLDAEVQRELKRGETFGVTLPAPLWELLNRVVSAEGVEQEALLGPGGRVTAFRVFRARRRIDELRRLGYVRRDGDRWMPTVAGMGVVRPFMSPKTSSAMFPVLREMRRAETARVASSAEALL